MSTIAFCLLVSLLWTAEWWLAYLFGVNIDHLGLRLAGWRLADCRTMQWDFYYTDHGAPIYRTRGVVEFWVRSAGWCQRPIRRVYLIRGRDRLLIHQEPETNTENPSCP